MRPGPDRHPLAPVLAHLRAWRLDRQLAAGVESWRSPVHAARARQLTSNRTRRMLARSLERLVEQAEKPTSLHRAAVVQPSRAGVREARPLILTLASRLRGNAPVGARGMAALKDLLTDAAGPIYTHGHPETVKRRLQTIDQWLDVQD
ncbi:MAG TPA: hypothetical protein VGI50_07125 [Solirubrobacteraceae bacterium]|jgi:hypothetical protein